MPVNTHHSWGRYPTASHAGVGRLFWADEPLPYVADGCKVLPYGCGRSYGDVCLNDGGYLIETRRLNRFIRFDADAGVLEAEAGATLGEILGVIVPKGWFLPVVPGTKHVTLGGAIANDIHGKDHHRSGAFGCFVNRLVLKRSDGRSVECSPESNTELFAATVGGLGLTGLILSAEIRLRPIISTAIDVEEIRFDHLERFFELTASSDASHEYTVAWIDGLADGAELGRGIFIRGNHAADGGRAASGQGGIPFPTAVAGKALSRPTVRLFNRAYLARRRKKVTSFQTDFPRFFFPLDVIADWNRMYGKRGFLQYQFVVPEKAGRDVVRECLQACQRNGTPPYLAVLKRFGMVRSPGLLSFPRPGVTLALDFPVGSGRIFPVLDRLDERVAGSGGALYPAKDARMSPDVFRRSFPKLAEFRAHIDPGFSSSFWRRVSEGTP